ncbi:MAG: site-2 protease family protein [Deltaproteobacteria bacterium]|nr:site-2 protease family protein [Deltaproteobacteria bacterium]
MNVGAIAGVPVRVHVTLLLLLVWVALSYWVRGVSPSATVTGVVLVVSVFLIVLVHELTHALMARRFGVHTRDILLLPIGGIASLERIPDRPSQELAIALIGPAFNLVLALALYVGLTLAGGRLDLDATTSLGETIVVQLIAINVALGVFNLLPAFPLDGGRAFRALLAMWMRRDRATQIAAGLGKLMAFALGVFGLFFNVWLVLIALVIWFGARMEVERMQLRSELVGVPVSAVMRGRIDEVDASETLARAAAIALRNASSAISIVDLGRTLGVLTQRDIAVGIDAAGPDAPVTSAPHHAIVAIPPDEPLEKVLDLLESDPDVIPIVVDATGPIGVVTPEQLASYATLHAHPRAAA